MQNKLVQVIKELMKERGIKHQKDMATLLDIDPAQFSRMLRMSESESVSVKVLANLYTHFGITPNDVLLWEMEVVPTFAPPTPSAVASDSKRRNTKASKP